MVWDLSKEAPHDVPTPKGLVGGLDWSNDGRRLAFSLSSSSANSDVWLFELDGRGSTRGGLSRLTTSSTCGIPEASFVEPELVKTRSFDELEIPSYLYLPKTRQALSAHRASSRRPRVPVQAWL